MFDRTSDESFHSNMNFERVVIFPRHSEIKRCITNRILNTRKIAKMRKTKNERMCCCFVDRPENKITIFI